MSDDAGFLRAQAERCRRLAAESIHDAEVGGKLREMAAEFAGKADEIESSAMSPDEQEEDAGLLRQVAADMIAHHGRDAAKFALDRMKIAYGDDPSVEAWHDIARAVTEELRQFRQRRS